MSLFYSFFRSSRIDFQVKEADEASQNLKGSLSSRKSLPYSPSIPKPKRCTGNDRQPKGTISSEVPFQHQETEPLQCTSCLKISILLMVQKSCTSWCGKCPMNYRVFHIPSGCLDFFHQQYLKIYPSNIPVCLVMTVQPEGT